MLKITATWTLKILGVSLAFYGVIWILFFYERVRTSIMSKVKGHRIRAYSQLNI